MNRWGALLRIAFAGAGVAAAVPVGAAEYYIADRDVDALMAALREASATPEFDSIHLADGGLYLLTASHDRDVLLPRLHGRLEIHGYGSELRRGTHESLALLDVSEHADVDLHDLTLAEGGRGSIRNHGSLRMHRIAVVDATTRAEAAIVQNFGHFEARDCLIGYNQVAGAGRDAAILLNYGSMRLQDTRVSGNSLSRRFPTLAAAPLLNFGSLQLVRVSLDGNVVTDELGGLVSETILNLGVGRLLGPEAGHLIGVAMQP